MDNVFFVELIIKSYNNAFDSGSYMYEENNFIVKGNGVENLNNYIKSNFRYRFLTELIRVQKILKETDKVELHSFLAKVREASYLLNNNVLLYKEREYQKNRNINLSSDTIDDKSLFFELIESYEESYDISLSSIISKAKKEILFNLIDLSFITQMIETLSLDDFESKNKEDIIKDDLSNSYRGEEANKLASELFDFLCKHYKKDKHTSVKYINILHYLRNDVDKRKYIFNLNQTRYRELIKKVANVNITKFSKSEKYDESERPILDELEMSFISSKRQ